MAIDVTTAFLLVAALQLVAVAELAYVIDHCRRADPAAKAAPAPIRSLPRPHRHVWLPRSEEMTQGKRVRVHVCAEPNCPDRMREEVDDG